MKAKEKVMPSIPKEVPISSSDNVPTSELIKVVKSLQEQKNRFHEMAVKAQGAIEVLLQVIPKEEVAKMIAKENKDNGEMVDDTETVN